MIPLLSQAALEAAYYSRNLPGKLIPVAIVGANHISDSVSEEAKESYESVLPRSPSDYWILRVFARSPVMDSRI